MKSFNLSLIIPSYVEYKNVLQFLTYVKNLGITFNNVYIVADKLEDVSVENSIECYKFKNQVWLMDDIRKINKSTHGGVIGTVNYIHDMPFDNDENVVILEDDLFATVEFFEQCETYFSNICSDSLPIFVGYSKTNEKDEGFFNTYNLLYMWGFAMKFGTLKKVIEYHNTVRKYTKEQKQAIIDDVLNFKYPCNKFEKYKKDLMNTIRQNFMANSKESVDLYFWFYFLQNRLKIVKPLTTHVLSFKPEEFDEEISDDIELDIKNTIHCFKI